MVLQIFIIFGATSQKKKKQSDLISNFINTYFYTLFHVPHQCHTSVLEKWCATVLKTCYKIHLEKRKMLISDMYSVDTNLLSWYKFVIGLMLGRNVIRLYCQQAQRDFNWAVLSESPERFQLGSGLMNCRTMVSEGQQQKSTWRDPKDNNKSRLDTSAALLKIRQ